MISWKFEELVAKLEQGETDRFNRVKVGDWMMYNANQGEPAMLAFKGHLVASGSDIEALRNDLEVAIKVAKATLRDMDSPGAFTVPG